MPHEICICAVGIFSTLHSVADTPQSHCPPVVHAQTIMTNRFFLPWQLLLDGFPAPDVRCHGHLVRIPFLRFQSAFCNSMTACLLCMLLTCSPVYCRDA